MTASGSPVRGVAADDAHVADPAVAELGEDGEPELRRLPGRGADPHPEDSLDPVGVDPDREVDRPVPDDPVADLHHERIDEDHRIDRVQGPGLPLGELLDDGVGDPADQVRADVDVVHLPQVRLDVTGGHPTPVEGDDAVVEPVETGLAQPGRSSGRSCRCGLEGRPARPRRPR